MNPTPPDDSQDQLIGRFLDGIASEEEAARLSKLIEENPSARERYLDFSELHATLSADESLRWPQDEEADEALPPMVSKRVAVFPWWRVAAAASLVGLIAFGAWAAFRADEKKAADEFAADGPLSTRAEMADAVAVLKRAVGVEWANAAEAAAVGEMVPAGWLRLRSGTVQLEFLSGARLLVQGPADVRLDTDNSAYLENGKASAYVPQPAHGFKLLAPGMGVEDFGTAFGMEILKDQAVEVHVFDGSVSLMANGQDQPNTVEMERAMRFQGNQFKEVLYRPMDFPNGEVLEQRLVEENRERLGKWRESMAKISKDPETLVNFSFDGDKEWSRGVRNHAVRDVATNGTVVGAGWTGGRWQGKQGIEFRSLGDRLSFSVPGSYQEISLMAWVRVDSLPNDYNSLLMPSHYANGSIHWTMERGGELRLAMLNNAVMPLSPNRWDGPVSGPAVSSMDFGRWLFLTTTYNCASGALNHYRDGILVGGGSLQHRLPIVLGQLEFGNWGADGTAYDNKWVKQQPKNQQTRNFVGRLDQLTILSRALNSQEVWNLFEVGRP